MTKITTPSAAPLFPPATTGAAATRQVAPSPGGTFREILKETLSGVGRAERALGESVTRVARRQASPEELIVLQAAVYRASRDFELLAKVIDKSAGAVRQALQSGSNG